MSRLKAHSLTAGVLLAVILLVPACHSNKKLVASGVMFSTVKFGSSGGFTNLTTTYVIEADGGLYKSGPNAVTQLGTLENSEILRIESDLQELRFGDLELSEVGNMTYFIEVARQDSMHKVTWTHATEAPEIKAFYTSLTDLLK